MIYKYYGPPGTGKTFKLISRSKAYARLGTPLHKIGYFAFSKKAAGVAKERMPASDKNLPYFQTLHSFCFNFLDMKKEDIMQPYHYEKFGKEINVKVKYADKYNKEEISYLTCDNPYFQLIHKAVNKCITVREEYELWEHDTKEVIWSTLKYISDNLIKYKDAKNLYDFNDLVDLTIKSKDKENFPTFKAVFIDEAQDLSPIQWKLYDILKSKSKNIYLAGDDDQAIYGWAGADVDRFIQEPATEKVLSRSRRIPRAVQDVSEIITARIAGLRATKNYLPRDEEGLCSKINSLENVDLHQDKWLILTRTLSRAKEVCDLLKVKGLYYENRHQKSYNTKLYKAIINHSKWLNGEEVSDTALEDIKEYMGNRELKKDLKWFECFDNAPADDKIYIRLMLSNKERLSDDARIKVSTIHAAKGGECENVILVLDNAKKIREAITKSIIKRDEEHRVWYVGCTRAKRNLYLMRAKIERKGYPL